MTSTDLPTIDELAEQIAAAMRSEQRQFERRLHSIRERQRRKQPFDRSLGKLAAEVERSVQRRAKRLAVVPLITYDDVLPIVQRKDEILSTIRENQVVVVCGETGSGKSTQLPKICLELGRGIDGMIGHTQPRRIAARSVAGRVAEELETTRDVVGFKIRFTDTTRPQTLIKLMTDGILLAETQSDRYLNQYDTIIVDEAHERSLNIDFLLGYIKRILPSRPDLRVIITSATIDAERFAEFFKIDREVPIIEVSGRTYPVEVRFAPPEPDEGEEIDWQRATADACEELALEGDGDILVFMPTERDIRETARVLRGRKFPGPPTEILPLFGRLSEQEQNRVFKSHTGRRIVIATNVAESSLTVPGIKYVVDPGTARISRFSATSKVQRLPIEPISQASAKQRAGRCGRIAPGICVRLYSAADFRSRDEFTQPEILRTNLASVLLQMMAYQLGRLEEFPFIDPPNPSSVRSALKTLYELGAIDEQEQVTTLGSSLAKLPVDPRIGRMIIAAADEHCLEEVLIIASALELRDPRERPLDKQQAADQAHEKFQHERSDFLSLLKLWDFYDALDEKLSNSKVRKACVQNFLSYNRMREWRDLHRQLREIVLERGLKPTPRKNNEDAIHRAILSGLLSNIALKGDAHDYTGAGGQKLFIWPGSVGFSSKPKWLMAAELVETSKRFARTIAPVNPQWIERAAEHLVKRTYSEPHWSAKQAAVMAYEKVLLFGLPLVAGRPTRYGKVDPVAARTLFIQHALVQREYDSPGEFTKHNLAFREELREWQAKLRSGAHFIGDEVEFEFYDQRIPAGISDGPSFEKWRKQAEQENPRLLFQTKADFLIEEADAPQKAAFPDAIRVGSMELKVEYHLEPGSEHDGVTVLVPPEGLNQLSNDNLGWLVPGLVEEKVAALIKTLPKQLRILFVPAPATAKEVTPRLEYGKGSLLTQLAAELRRISGEHVPVSAFETERLPSHLQFNVRVVDRNGKEIASGRDVTQLRQTSHATSSHTITAIVDPRWKKDQLTSWNFGELPAKVELDRQGTKVPAYPMLVDQRNAIGLRLASSPLIAETETRKALVRLLFLQQAKLFLEQLHHFPKIDQLAIQASALPDGKRFKDHVLWLMTEAALFAENTIPRTAGQWDLRMRQAKNRLPLVVQDLAKLLGPLLQGYHAARRLLEEHHPPALEPLKHDLREQLEALVRPGFLVSTPLPWLKQYPRYFDGLQRRWRKAINGNFPKDRQFQKQFEGHWIRWRTLDAELQASGQVNPQLNHFRWLIEEFRISLFVQEMGTAVPVSEKRLQELWQSITASKRNSNS